MIVPTCSDPTTTSNTYVRKAINTNNVNLLGTLPRGGGGRGVVWKGLEVQHRFQCNHIICFDGFPYELFRIFRNEFREVDFLYFRYNFTFLDFDYYVAKYFVFCLNVDA